MAEHCAVAALEVQKLHLFPQRCPFSLSHNDKRVVIATFHTVILKSIAQTQTPTEFRVKGL